MEVTAVHLDESEQVNVIYLMSITRGVLEQSPEPEAHDKVLDNNPDQIGIWKCWFLRRGENRSTRRKTSRSKDENPGHTVMKEGRVDWIQRRITEY